LSFSLVHRRYVVALGVVIVTAYFFRNRKFLVYISDSIFQITHFHGPLTLGFGSDLVQRCEWWNRSIPLFFVSLLLQLSLMAVGRSVVRSLSATPLRIWNQNFDYPLLQLFLQRCHADELYRVFDVYQCDNGTVIPLSGAQSPVKGSCW
jgi:hypothetical protein